MAAACAMLDERHQPLPPRGDSHDQNNGNHNYVLGRIGSHNVVVACLPTGVTGTISAARVVHQMLATFKRLRFGLLVGIGGGAPSAENDIRLGDVVVGKPTGFLGGVIQYDFGKTVQNGRFVRTGMLNKPPETVLMAMSILQAKHMMEGHGIDSTIRQMVDQFPAMKAHFTHPGAGTDTLYQADYEHPENEPSCSECDPRRVVKRVPRHGLLPVIHYGLIASGDQVMRHGATREKLRKDFDVLCFEMEAAGIMDSLPFAIIRGISDYADSHKNNSWQGYAAATAAAYAKELVSVIPPAEPRSLQPVANGPESNEMLRDSVQRWLSPADAQDDLYRHGNECMRGSCDWALETEVVRAFLEDKTDTEILRIGGAPGNGKTTLTAFLINHLFETSSAEVLYFFCKATDETKNRPLQVFRSLLSQLLLKTDSSDLYSKIDKLRLQSGQNTAQSFATLSHALHDALRQDSHISPLYIVVEALDECHDRASLALSLITAAEQSKRTVKLILTSRDDPDLLEVFSQHHGKQPQLKELSITPANTRQPVKAYIQERTYRLKHINRNTLARVVLREVSAAADGSWLYARLMMDEIQRLPSAGAIRRQLDNIPNGVIQLHRRSFERMEETLSPLELRLSQQAFLWIDMLDFVHVKNLHVDRNVLDIVFQAENGGEPVFDSIDLARRLCSPLVTFKQTQKEGRHSVEFVHQTAAWFVRQCTKRRTDTGEKIIVPRILKPQALKALYRAATSVWYYTSCATSSHLLEYLRANPCSEELNQQPASYFEMAYALWGAFFLNRLPVDNLEEDEIEQAAALCKRLTDFLQSEVCLKWVETAIIINYEGRFAQLTSNINRAITASRKMRDAHNTYRLPFLHDFARVRSQFFETYAYVVSVTGPREWKDILPTRDTLQGPMATQLMSLGRKWMHLHEL